MVASGAAQNARPMKAIIVEFTECMAAIDRAHAKRAGADHAAASQRMQTLLLNILSLVANATSNNCSDVPTEEAEQSFYKPPGGFPKDATALHGGDKGLVASFD